MAKFPTSKLYFYNFLNTKKNIIGVGLYRKGFDAYIHHHKQAETYYLLWGHAKLQIGNKKEIIKAPTKRFIDRCRLHAITPISNYIILMYHFAGGPFCTVNYVFTDKVL